MTEPKGPKGLPGGTGWTGEDRMFDTQPLERKPKAQDEEGDAVHESKTRPSRHSDPYEKEGHFKFAE